MKNFTRLMVAVAILFCAVSANAQSKAWRLGFGIAPGYTTNKVFDYKHQFALGGDVRLQKGFGTGVSGILTAGFSEFFKKDLLESYGAIPVKAGLKVFPTQNFYVAAEGGIGFLTKENAWNGKDLSSNSPIFSPSAGITFAKNWDVSLKYDWYTKKYAPKELAIRLAYGFKL